MKKQKEKKIKLSEKELEMLQHSNWIEDEYSKEAFKDAQLAYAYGKRFMDVMNITHVLHIHKILLGRLRPDIAGKFRDCAVWIGGELKPKKSIYMLEQDIDNWLHSSYFSEASAPRLSHVAFERIHPFEDGNGRVGRILYNLELLMKGQDIHVIHQGDEQVEYYKWFLNTRTDKKKGRARSSARHAADFVDPNTLHRITSDIADMETSVSGYAQNAIEKSTTIPRGHTKRDI